MPEGDTIHSVARALGPRLTGEAALELVVLGQPIPLVERVVTRVEARGKHLILTLGGPVLRVHLGMTGSWHRYAPREPWQRPADRAGVVLRTPNHVAVCFEPAEAELYPDARRAELGILGQLGPDLLAAEFDPAAALSRARERDGGRSVADVLLDQRVACGIGNVYKSEVLFLQGLMPSSRALAVTDEALVACWETARALMQENVALGGPRTTTRAHFKGRSRRVPGALRHYVYGRAGRPCLRCAGRVEGDVQGEHLRTTFWCARCQVQRGEAG